MSVTETITTIAVTADRWDGDGRPDFWPIFPILWFLILVGIIATALYFRRRGCEGVPRRAGESRLAEMYAGGEISEDDYRARRAVLREK